MKKEKNQLNKGEIVIYQTQKGGTKIQVHLNEQTVWLTQKQMADLFTKDTRTINEHLKNIFKEKELNQKSVIRKFRITAADGKTYKTNFYNLDVIISVGYRVKSKRGTQFRIWATNILRQYLIKGITVNRKRIQELKGKQMVEFERALELVETTKNKAFVYDEARGLLDVITNYARTWLLLQKYDEGKLEMNGLTKDVKKIINYGEAQEAIVGLKADLINKKEASDIFGLERGNSLEGILNSISQSFGGNQLYPSVEEKAAHLLYFLIKDHPFADGNKRIAALLFLLFLSHNSYPLRDKKGDSKINQNALVALALLIAESQPKQKEIMIKLIINFLNK